MERRSFFWLRDNRRAWNAKTVGNAVAFVANIFRLLCTVLGKRTFYFFGCGVKSPFDKTDRGCFISYPRLVSWRFYGHGPFLSPWLMYKKGCHHYRPMFITKRPVSALAPRDILGKEFRGLVSLASSKSRCGRVVSAQVCSGRRAKPTSWKTFANRLKTLISAPGMAVRSAHKSTGILADLVKVLLEKVKLPVCRLSPWEFVQCRSMGISCLCIVHRIFSFFPFHTWRCMASLVKWVTDWIDCILATTSRASGRSRKEAKKRSQVNSMSHLIFSVSSKIGLEEQYDLMRSTVSFTLKGWYSRNRLQHRSKDSAQNGGFVLPFGLNWIETLNGGTSLWSCLQMTTW